MKRKKVKPKNKATCCNLGAMFAMDPTLDSSSFSSNKNDEECEIQHKKIKKISGKLVYCFKHAKTNTNITYVKSLDSRGKKYMASCNCSRREEVMHSYFSDFIYTLENLTKISDLKCFCL